MDDTYVALHTYSSIKDTYEIKDVVGDGWCFFYAVNGALGKENIGTQTKYQSSDDDVIQLIEGKDRTENASYNKEAIDKRTWANQDTIQSIASKNDMCIYIYFEHRKKIIERPIVFQADECNNGNSIYLILDLGTLTELQKNLLTYFEKNNRAYPRAIYDLLNDPSERTLGYHFKFLKEKGGTAPEEEDGDGDAPAEEEELAEEALPDDTGVTEKEESEKAKKREAREAAAKEAREAAAAAKKVARELEELLSEDQKEKENKKLVKANEIDTKETEIIPDNIDAKIKTTEKQVNEITTKKTNINNKYNNALKLHLLEAETPEPSGDSSTIAEPEAAEPEREAEAEPEAEAETETEAEPTELELEGEPAELVKKTKTQEELELSKFEYLKALGEFRKANDILKEVTELDKVIDKIVTGKADDVEITQEELDKIIEKAQEEVEEEDLDPAKKISLKYEIKSILTQFKKKSDRKKKKKKLIHNLLLPKFDNIILNNLYTNNNESVYITKTIEELENNIQSKANDLVAKHNDYENNKITIESIDDYIKKENDKIKPLVIEYITNTYNNIFDDGTTTNDTLLIPKLQKAITEYSTNKTKENLDAVNLAVALLKQARVKFVSQLNNALIPVYGSIRRLGFKIPNLPQDLEGAIKNKKELIDAALKLAGNALMRRLLNPAGFGAKSAYGNVINTRFGLNPLYQGVLQPIGHSIQKISFPNISISMLQYNKKFIIWVFVVIIAILLAYYSYLVWFIFHRRGALELAKKIQFQCGSTVMEKNTVRYPSNFALEHEKDCTNFLIVTWILLSIIIGIIIGFWLYLYKIQVPISSGQRVVFIGIILVSLTTLIMSTIFLNNSEKVSDSYNNSSENKQIKTQIALLIKGNTVASGTKPASYYQTLKQPLYFLPDKLEKRITGRILTDNNVSDPTALGINYYNEDNDNSAIIANQIFPYLKLGLDSDDIEILYGSSNNQVANSTAQNIIDFKCRINLNYVEGISQVDDRMGIIGYYEDKYRPIVWMTLLYSAIILLILFKLINSSYRPLLIGVFFIIYMITFFIIYTT